MTDKSPDPSALLDALVVFDDLKVWSMLVTILGDRTVEHGTGIPGPVLSALTQRMGIKPEAQRVALHRLRKDKWLETHKQGRVSHYTLSDTGRAETLAVQDRVFGPQAELPATCALIAFPSKAALKAAKGIMPIGPQMALAAVDWAGADGAISTPLEVHLVPQWAQRALIPQAITNTYAQLRALLAHHSPTPADFSAEDAQVLRLLVLHWWRKLVLGHSASAAALMPADWAGHLCRKQVGRLLQDFPKRPVGAI